MRSLICLLLASFLPLVTEGSSQEEPSIARVPLTEHRLYVADDRGGLVVYDQGRGHHRLRRIELPGTGDYRGMAVDVPGARLYISSHLRDEVVCLNLLTDEILWKKSFGKYHDGLAVTPNGKFLYVACRLSGKWMVVETARTKVIAELETTGQPHQVWASPKGDRVYLSARNNPYLYIADATSHKLVKNVGPFSSGLRPFHLTEDEKYVVANVDGLLGFEVGEIQSASMLYRLELQTPKERLNQVKNRLSPYQVPSHGIRVRPGTAEVWVSNDVYGYLHVVDAKNLGKGPPAQLRVIPQFSGADDQPLAGWVTFSLDGRYCYPASGIIFETATGKTAGRILASEKIVQIDFIGGKPVQASQR